MTAASFEMTTVFVNSSISSQLPNPNTACITQKEFAHDIAQLEFWGGDVTSNSLPSGTPMYMTFGRPPIMRAFYGYVNHATRVNNSMASDAVSRNALQVICVGASWPMKQTATTVYLNMTSTQIVQQIAAQFNLDANIDTVDDTTVWPVKQQGGLSYWQFCVQLMQEIGYTFYCNGIQLVAKPRQTNPNNLTSLVAVYDYRANPAGLPVFNPTLGATNPTGGQLMNRQLAGIDPRTNTPFYAYQAGSPGPSLLGVAQDEALFTKTETMTADSQAQATTKLQGVGQLNQMYLTATAVGSGNPLLSQGGLVFVQNANGSQNGLWWTCKVEHRLSPQTYAMNINFGRDSLGQTAAVRVMPQIQTPPNGILVNNQTWVAMAA